MGNVTQILGAIEQGDQLAAEQLLPLIYDELRRLAVHNMAHENPGQTLQATALVHEAYVRLVGRDQARLWDGRAHFFGAAAEAMRRILVEQARRKASLKRGGAARRIDLEELAVAASESSDDLLALGDALDELERHDMTAAKLVKLRYFAGLTHQQAAESLGIGRRAADRLWALARAWLYKRIGAT